MTDAIKVILALGLAWVIYKETGFYTAAFVLFALVSFELSYRFNAQVLEHMELSNTHWEILRNGR